MKKTILFLFILGFFTEGVLTQNVNITQRAHVPFAGQTLANICGFAKNGREYALLGGSLYTIIVDVTQPDTPKTIVQIPSINNLWKEIKTYKNIAYVTTEGGGGLQVIDLSALPDTSVAAYKAYNYVGDTTRNIIDTAIIGKMRAFHALHVDTTKGFVYLFGGNSAVSNGGALVLDLKPDPYRPKYAGQFNINTNYRANYIHDGYVDNDTLFAAMIYNGTFNVVDFRNKKSPTVIVSQTTPTAFTHNVWLTPNRKTLLTTDENTGSYLAAYDISNLSSIKLLDKVQNLSTGSIVHNTHILPNGNFAVTSWYKDGINIVDITRPQNLVVVGTYDTYTQGVGNGFNGAWGVYPFLPSGTLVVSNLDSGDGLYVLTPQYKRACYLEGIVRDSVTKQVLSGVSVKINSIDFDKKAVSDIGGNYRTGQVTAGTYSVTFSLSGYRSKTVNVPLVSGAVAQRDVELVNSLYNSVPELTDNIKVAVSPNPSSEDFYVQYRLENITADDATLYVYNILGQNILSQKLPTTEGGISLKNNWQSGIYTIQLKANGQLSHPIKVVKQ
ncbi:MAG: choice-of-anchor B family protein [Saprospiraceae bacterium]|nr:choice-of-anchor B family protein [Saprospiraceae bacterium]